MLRGDFDSIGKNSVIFPPFHSGNASRVSIGDDCSVFNNSWIECVPAYGSATYDPKVEIVITRISAFARILSLAAI